MLEGLESRALLAATLTPAAASLFTEGDGLKIAPDVSMPAEIQWQGTNHAADSKVVDSGSDLSKPKPKWAITPPKIETNVADRWVIDSIETQPSVPIPSAGATGPKAAVEEMAEVHDTLEKAQILPASDAVQISGTVFAGASSDVYCVVLSADMDSMTVSLANPGTAPRGEKHLQVMDAAGNVYGDIVLGAPNSHLSISMHPRVPRTERTLYLGVFVVSNDGVDDTTPDPYALSITQRLVAPESAVTEPVERYGPAHPAAVSSNPSTSSPGAEVAASRVTSPVQSGASESSTPTASIELANVVNQTSATNPLPMLVVAPDGGILSMGEGAAAYEQNAMAVDLALIGLDSNDEEPIDSDLLCDGADGQDDWEVVLLRPAAGLPIGMPTLEEHTPDRNLAAKDATPNASVRLSPPPMEAPPEDAERKTRRWQLLQTGVGIATAAAFALLMPDAALMLHEPKPRTRRRSQALAKSNPDQPGDL